MTSNRFQFVVTLQAYFQDMKFVCTNKLFRDEWIKPQTVCWYVSITNGYGGPQY
jgi:hypothetical protein